MKETLANKGGENQPNSQSSEKDLQIWRGKFDDLKAKTLKKGEHLAAIQDKLNDLDVNTKVKEDVPDSMKHVRILENRLDKAMLKLNEAVSIKKTYDIIIKKLKEERVLYDK